MAVVGSTPDGRKFATKQLLVAFFAELVRAIHTIHTIFVQEFFANVLTKNVAGTARRYAKALRVTFWVAPHQVCKGALVRNFLHALNLFNVLDVVDGWREATMYCEKSCIDDGADRQEIEDVSEHGPDAWATILLLAFHLEAINCGNLPRLMIASNQADAQRVPQFE